MGRARGAVAALALALALGVAARSQPDTCLLPKVVGRCRAAFPRWWFNASSQECQQFIFGGCKGNDNNFFTPEDCRQKCSSESCSAPPAVGSCRASFSRWYFDTETQTCRKFIYGGCGGNKNNYRSQEQCLRQCSGAGETSHGQEEPHTHPHSFAGPLVHPVRVVVVAVLLAVMVTVLLGTMVLFVAKIWKSRRLSLGPVWSTLDDKERLMSNAYTL